MAIMVVKIEDKSSLKMNEFFDYNGQCWALSRSRSQTLATGAMLEDFYECTVLTDWVEDIPVIFLCQDEARAAFKICGWYRRAKIYRKVRHPSIFLEGNICARAVDAVMLKDGRWRSLLPCMPSGGSIFDGKLYYVIEDDVPGYEELEKLVGVSGESPVALEDMAPVRYAFVPSYEDKGRIRREAAALLGGPKSRPTAKAMAQAQYVCCIRECEKYAGRLMNDQCQGISDLKTLKEYGRMASVFSPGQADGYYYEAMANEQLGFVKDGLKVIAKAIAIEPDGADLLALKANLLAAFGKFEEAARLYQESFDISGDESYLLMKGHTFSMMGNMEQAYKAYTQIKDRSILKEAGINLKDMEHRWPFGAIRGLKNLIKRGVEES
ncbi:hypothetical protein HNP82_001001 [Catenibacillus scindens]|uniref:Tetratricopeptide repeat protein n=1 Tax=Catenibacillus scindens TaxID=673271 RepID=A0A7W8H8N4_9FIRM|nr:hypothetical protein [Catenibacillus scindens]MBB5263896.1 hypothetical protein [Catenibacillus scindens]